MLKTRAGILSLALASLAALPLQALARQSLPHHVPPEVAGAALLGDLPPSFGLQLAISLPLGNQRDLQDLLRGLYDPNSPSYRHFLTPAEFTERFGPSLSQYQALADFVRARGLRVTKTYANRLVLDVSGNAATVNKVFHTHLRRWRGGDAREFYAPDADPSIDFDLPLAHVSGLDNAVRPRHSGIFRRTSHGPFRRSGPAPRPAAGTGLNDLYAGADFRDIYIPCATATGAGQTLALFEVDAYYQTDINDYVSDTGINAPTLNNVLLDGFRGKVKNDNDEVEVALDIEMAASMAPGLSEIVVYEGNPSDFIPDDILSSIASPPSGVPLSKQVSSSWTWTGGSPDPEIPTLFEEFAAQGQSYFQAAGDDGAYVTGDPDATVPDPIIDTSMMTVVGGTSLTTSGPVDGTAGAYVSETTWNDSPGPAATETPATNAVGGGGICTALQIPSYQAPFINAQNEGSNKFRDIPDVSMVADSIFLEAEDGKSFSAGGTSAATPLWAGVLALVNQQIAPTTVGLANPLLYGAASAGSYAADYNDIKDNSTNNYWNGPASGLYPAVAGYDLATGLGSPRCGLFAALIAQVTLSPTPDVSPTSTVVQSRTFTASPTPTRSSTGTRTATPTPSSSATGTFTLSASPSQTPTESPSRTASPTATLTDSPTQSATLSASASPSLTPTQSQTWTASSTATPTDSPTESATLSPSVSPSQTPTQSQTGTSSPTATATATITPTFTQTQSASPSPMVTDSASPTATPPFSATVTLSATQSGTQTVSGTATSTPMDTPSPTSSASQTATPSATPSPSSSDSGTPTSTSSASPTPSATPSPTATDSGTPSATSSASATPSGTPSPTATDSETPSATSSASATATASVTPSQIFTDSATPTSTSSATDTATVTPLQTLIPSGNITPTPVCPGCPQGVIAVPNPASSQITVYAPWTASSPGRLEVLDLAGGLVYSRDFGAPASGEVSEQVNISGWAGGVYFVALRSGGAGGPLVGIFKLAVVRGGHPGGLLP
ncbi:MAG TPA: protease pro-enzyme activation domain-containing protein [bacterium]|jgi:hypothetical protein|nr:protease pro-enzyme activation domain-containing protein [bacterium]